MARSATPEAAGLGPGPDGMGGPDAIPDDVTLVYGWDALCGWCFGFIPALRHLTTVLPTLRVAVLPGGLMKGDRVGPYAKDLDYIRNAAARMEAVTGQAPALPFWNLIEEPDSPLASSAPPALAVLRMQAESPETALDFAHCIQEAHFIEGKDLNLPETYEAILERFVMPRIVTEDLGSASETTPEVATAYARAEGFGLTSLPALLLAGRGGELGHISDVYDGRELVERVRALL